MNQQLKEQILETFEEYKQNLDYHRRKDILEDLSFGDIMEMAGDYAKAVKRDLIDYIIDNNLDKDYQ